ncbi:response regulator [Spirulina subsalsa]|uniref:response regulator n=1 Tax=Spirulina subsalsa TaxID=54311 RepID=UPI0002ED5B31|nr:response regulator [Spirulina subsalsa]
MKSRLLNSIVLNKTHSPVVKLTQEHQPQKYQNPPNTPMHGEQPTPNNLESILGIYHKQQFTGRLDVEVSPGQHWSLYLTLGRFSWATGGVHPTRRWRRQMIRNDLLSSASKVRLRQNDRFECWDYQVLTLLAQRRIANGEQVIAVIRGTVTEVLFEILQATQLATLSQVAARSPDQGGEPNPSHGNGEELIKIVPALGVRPSNTDTGILPRNWTLEIQPALDMTQKVWEYWAKSGLALCSPNLAPVLTQQEKLQEKTSAQVYKHLVELINGKRTLRDLAVLTKKDLLSLTRSLLPYLRAHYIGLVEIADLPEPNLKIANAARPSAEKPLAPEQDLVVCVDDSPQVCQMMEELLTNAGYKCITVQQAVDALPVILKNKPALIFLDLMMPIASGYEICTQIRRVAILKETPVIILTGNDGIVDRVRAKIVGATDFLAKPIDSEKVLSVIRKHTKTTNMVES